MRGWIVLYSYGNCPSILPKHYVTQKNAEKFAEEHRNMCLRHRVGGEAVVLNVEDLVTWINSGVAELERMFRL